MGRVRTKTVKKASRVIIEKYYPRLTDDFQLNKKICQEVANPSSKRQRNRIAGFVTHLMSRIARGPVRGISFRLQEEERERKDNYVPDVSALDVPVIDIDEDTEALLAHLDLKLPNVKSRKIMAGGDRDHHHHGGARHVPGATFRPRGGATDRPPRGPGGGNRGERRGPPPPRA